MSSTNLQNDVALSPHFFLQVFGHDRVSVLDGGLKKWEAEGLETESGEGSNVEVCCCVVVVVVVVVVSSFSI